MDDDERVILQERLRRLEVALNRILELVDAVDETSEESTLMEIANLAEAALAL
ncbi:MAG TPA: hypothetical protein VGU71_22525 [Candidatus Dormibacteraeota bacterium]|nr:hypothetical protein [Candidatus Dormibacteraeota bacterium]